MLPGYRDILFVAQRRPERQPRLHFLWRVEASEQVRRSTKAGASTPATHVGRWHPGHTRRRSTKAGASTPATPDQSADRCRVPDSLNEGRSVNPGYTYPPWYDMQNCHCAQRRPERQPRLHPRRPACAQPRQSRSTKAGASTPATRIPRSTAWTWPAPLNESRSVNPGYTGLQVIGEVRGGRRSTKAGASTPATLLGTSTNRRPPRPLNEGRSVNPGYTRRPPPRYQFPRTLNEGRSVNPGYTF